MFYKAELQKKNAIKLDQKLKEYGIPEFMWKFFRAKIKSKAAALKYLSMIKNFLLYALENNLIQKTEISALEPQDFNNIMAEDITEYLEIQEMNGVSPTTLNTKKNVLRSFWNYLARLSETNIDRDFFEDVTYEGISSSHGQNVIEKFPLQSELDEMESKILKISNDFTRNRNLTIFNILKGTGLRKSELIGLDIQNVCLNAEIPYIKVIGKGKYREEEARTVYLSGSVNDELSKWINYRNDMADIHKWNTNALFVNINGERLLERGVDGIFDRYGDRITPHMMRHYYISVTRKIDEVFTKQQVGHASLEITEGTYTNAVYDKKDILANM